MRTTFKALICCIFVFIIFSVLPASAQNSENPYMPDQRLYQVMDKAYLDQLFIDKPELILYYNYYLDHSFYVAKLDNEKPVTGTDIHSVSLITKGNTDKKFSETVFNPSVFNVFKYDFGRDLDRFTTYVWQEAGVALVFLPQRHFQAQFKEYSKSINK